MATIDIVAHCYSQGLLAGSFPYVLANRLCHSIEQIRAAVNIAHDVDSVRDRPRKVGITQRSQPIATIVVNTLRPNQALGHIHVSCLSRYKDTVCASS